MREWAKVMRRDQCENDNNNDNRQYATVFMVMAVRRFCSLASTAAATTDGVQHAHVPRFKGASSRARQQPARQFFFTICTACGQLLGCVPPVTATADRNAHLCP